MALFTVFTVLVWLPTAGSHIIPLKANGKFDARVAIGYTSGTHTVTVTVVAYLTSGPDGCPSDPAKVEPGVCGCGTPDEDSDGDGTPDCEDGCPHDPRKTTVPGEGECGCGIGTSGTSDVDGDGIADCMDPCPHVAGAYCPDVCPAGWWYASGRCWRTTPFKRLFHVFMGDDGCMGGTLAAIFSDQDNAVASNVCALTGTGDYCYIG